MRRAAALVTVLGLMMMATTALGAVEAEPGSSQSYKDLFGSVSYSGSDGSIPWGSSWEEIGEGDGPSKGTVHIHADPYCADFQCLHIFGQGETYSLIGVVRSADLSGFNQANLAYDVRRFFDEDVADIGDAELLIQVSANGSNWETIDSFGLETIDPNPIRSTKNIKKWISKTFAIRFVVTGTLGSGVFVDNVRVKGTIPPEPTTTTTSTETTTTKPHPTTTTTDRLTTTTETTTTTTVPRTTATTVAAVVVPSATPPSGGGIRETASGVQADYSPGLFGSIEMGEPEVLGVELNADYKMAVEVIESSWVWMVALLVVIAAAIVGGLDRRKTLSIRPDV